MYSVENSWNLLLSFEWEPFVFQKAMGSSDLVCEFLIAVCRDCSPGLLAWQSLDMKCTRTDEHLRDLAASCARYLTVKSWPLGGVHSQYNTSLSVKCCQKAERMSCEVQIRLEIKVVRPCKDLTCVYHNWWLFSLTIFSWFANTSFYHLQRVWRCVRCPLSVCNTITFKALNQEVHFWSEAMSSGDTGQVRIWRSSDQGQDYRSKNAKFPIPAL